MEEQLYIARNAHMARGRRECGFVETKVVNEEAKGRIRQSGCEVWRVRAVNSRRCGDCVFKFEAELDAQSQNTLERVQKKPRKQ